MNQKEREKLKYITDKLYVINANISITCIGMTYRLKQSDVIFLNKEISKIIKELREVYKDD